MPWFAIIFVAAACSVALVGAVAAPKAPAQARQPGSAAPRAGETFRDCPDCPEMVVVPAGSFMMGSPENEDEHSPDEGPQRKVTIARPFAVGKFEVTFAEWDACVSDGGCKYKPETRWGRGRQPVSRVSWDHVTKEYLPWLSRKTGKAYRLLTEAEWEYAARAATTTPFSTGPTITTEQANFNGNHTYGSGAKGVYRDKTVEVGSFRPNAFGLYDMHGNVWEWVQDCYKFGYESAPVDGSAAATNTRNCSRVERGGSFVDEPFRLRSASRFYSPTFELFTGLGFRVGLTLPLTS